MPCHLSELNHLSKAIIGSAIEVHREMGPGLLESIYEQCLLAELSRRGLRVETQVQLPLAYKGEVLDKALVLDLVVEDSIILELKAVEVMLPVHSAQLLSYLRLTGKRWDCSSTFVCPSCRRALSGESTTVCKSPEADHLPNSPPWSRAWI